MKIFKRQRLLTVALTLMLTWTAWAGSITRMQRIGPVEIAMSVSELKAAIGPPAHQGDTEVDASSGWDAATLNYPGHGLKIRVVNDPSKKGWKVWGFTAKAPCHWKTGQGIRIGSTRDEVQAAYKDYVDGSASSEDMVMIGDSHDGIIFRMKAGRVDEINFGPGAP